MSAASHRADIITLPTTQVLAEYVQLSMTFVIGLLALPTHDDMHDMGN